MSICEGSKPRFQTFSEIEIKNLKKNLRQRLRKKYVEKSQLQSKSKEKQKSVVASVGTQNSVLLMTARTGVTRPDSTDQGYQNTITG